MIAGLDRTPLYDWGRSGGTKAWCHFSRLRATRPSRGCSISRGSCARRASTIARCSRPTTSRCRHRAAAVEVDQARRQQRHGAKASALSWRLDQRAEDLRSRSTEMIEFLDRYHGQVNGMFSGDESLSGPQPAAGDRAVRGRRVHVLARDALLGVRRRRFRRSTRARRVQRAPGGDFAGHVVAPVRPAGQPGAVHDQSRARMVDQRAGVESVRPRAQLRLLHVEHAPGVAEVRRPPVDADARRGLVVAAWTPCAGRRMCAALTSGVRRQYRLPVPRNDEPRRDSGPAAARLPSRSACPRGPRARRCGVCRRRVEKRVKAGTFHRSIANGRENEQVAVRASHASRCHRRYNEAVAFERGPLLYALRIGRSNGRASTPTSRTASCRTATSRSDRRPRGTTGSSATRASSPVWRSRSAPSASAPSRRKGQA